MKPVYLHFYQLSFVSDQDEVIIGRVDIGSYAAFPESGAALVKKMQDNMSILDAAAWYKQEYSEEVDMDDFIDTLQDLQFIQGGMKGELQGKKAVLISPLWQQIGKMAFSPGGWIVYMLLVVGCISMMLHVPRLIPTYHNLFFSPFASVIEIGLFFGELPGLLFHELYHSLSGKRLGLPTRLSVGHRANYIVFETDMTAIWSIPRKQRYLPFLAGMVADVIYFSLLTIIAGLLLNSSSWLAFFGTFCAALATSTLFRLFWQLNFYLQTDLYYVFSSLFGCINLHNTVKAYLLNRFWRVLGYANKVTDERSWHPRDRQMLPWYLSFFIGGYAATIGLFVYGLFPFFFQLLSNVLMHLKANSWNTVPFWDSFIFFAMSTAEIILLIAIIVRDYQRKRKNISGHRKSTAFS